MWRLKGGLLHQGERQPRTTERERERDLESTSLDKLYRVFTVISKDFKVCS